MFIQYFFIFYWLLEGAHFRWPRWESLHLRPYEVVGLKIAHMRRRIRRGCHHVLTLQLAELGPRLSISSIKSFNEYAKWRETIKNKWKNVTHWPIGSSFKRTPTVMSQLGHEVLSKITVAHCDGPSKIDFSKKFYFLTSNSKVYLSVKIDLLVYQGMLKISQINITRYIFIYHHSSRVWKFAEKNFYAKKIFNPS